MKHHVNFTPGPSQLYFTVNDHARQAFKEGIPSISHRSKLFEQISSEATVGLRQLLNIPADFYIFFTSSANEIWERITQNLVEEKWIDQLKKKYPVAINTKGKKSVIQELTTKK